MKWLVLSLLLIFTTPADAAILFFSGFETGDLKEWGSGAGAISVISTAPCPTASGGYCMQNLLTTAHLDKSGFNQSTDFFVRLWFNWASASGTGPVVVEVVDSVIAHGIAICLDTATNHLVATLNPTGGANCVSAAFATGTTALTQNAWHIVNVHFVKSPTVGGAEVILDGHTEFSSFGTNTSSLTDLDILRIGSPWSALSVQFFYDNMMVCSSAYCPEGVTIARQGAGGSPTYTAWTKNSCTSNLIENCWSQTPFNATPNASDAVLNDAQTMLVHDFATTQTGHGTQTIGGASTINGCKTAMVAKGSSGTPSVSIRRRLSASDTDTAVTLATTDGYYDDGIWTTTPAVLRGSTVEIGAVQGANAVTETVEDMWLICDYLNRDFAPRHRVYQQ